MLAFEKRGTGIPLVFIHAYPLDHTMWEPQISAFSKNFQVIIPDLPGFGSSPLRKNTSSMQSMAEAILELLDELHIKDKCVFTGLSMGGYVLFQILKLAPEKIRGLVLMSTRAAADSESARSKRFQTIGILEKQGIKSLVEIMKPSLLGKTALQNQSSLVTQVEAMILQQKVEGVCASLRGMAERPDSTYLLSSIKVPSLFVSGAEDVVIPTADMQDMTILVPGSEFKKIESAGHLLNLEQPAVFNDLFLHFLKRRVL